MLKQMLKIIQSPFNNKQNISFLPVNSIYNEILFKIFKSVRKYEWEIMPPSEPQKRIMQRQQFEAQELQSRTNFPQADFKIIQLGRKSVGRLYINHDPRNIHIIDITLLPAFRNQGIGSQILRQILENARTYNKTVSLHVQQHNPALALYRRLNFQIVYASPSYLFMEWVPTSHGYLQSSNLTIA